MITFYELYLLGAATTYAMAIGITSSEKQPATALGRVAVSALSATMWPLFLGWTIGEIHTKLHSK